MAYSPSPTSPLAGIGRSIPYGHRSPTPPHQPPSKKEKRRTQHLAHQQELIDDFSNNREAHYRRQLIALQNDMNLIIHADTYSPEPLDDSPDGIDRIAKQLAASTPYQHDLSVLAGKWYTEFVHEVNDAKEAKELDLIRIGNEHESALQRLESDCDFKCVLAANEYESMNNTLRERLVTKLSAARQRLMKEKEQLDIADTNALLLHPNQFTITNPLSPGGHTGRKNTRQTRHRGDQDDLNHGSHETTNKRKRKFIDDDIGSPSRNGATTPAGRGRGADALAQQTAPVYSVSSLFTDKEQWFQSHNAQIATRHFFATSRQDNEVNGGRRRGRDNDEDKSTDSGEDSTPEEDGDVEAPEMDRTASQNVHVTRSTRTVGLSGLNILSDLAEKASTRPALPYATLHTHQPTKAGTFLPTPSKLLDSEVQEDLIKIQQIMQQPPGVVDKKILDDALLPISHSRSMLAPDWPVYLDVHLQEVDPRTAL